ncbi:hypothetical protein Tco_0172621 [Tanacetum coccineum]
MLYTPKSIKSRMYTFLPPGCCTIPFVGSSASYVILSISEAAIVTVPAIAPEIAPEVALEAEAATVAPSSPNYVPASPDYFPGSDPESDPEESPSEDPSEDDSSDDTLEAAGPLAVQVVPAPTALL